MASYSTSEFKGGLKVMLDGDPCSIIENEFVKPGKGQAFNRVKIRNLITGRVLEKTFKSGESLEGADVHETDMQYLYTDGEFWYFMDPQTFEQVSADARALGEVGEVAERTGHVHHHPVERHADQCGTSEIRGADHHRDRSGCQG